MIYQKLIEVNPDFIKAYEHKSSLLMKTDKYKEASMTLNDLLKNNCDYFNAYAGIGVCFEKMGKFSDAKRYYRKFLSLNPFSPQKSFITDRINKLKYVSCDFFKKNAPKLQIIN